MLATVASLVESTQLNQTSCLKKVQGTAFICWIIYNGNVSVFLEYLFTSVYLSLFTSLVPEYKELRDISICYRHQISIVFIPVFQVVVVSWKALMSVPPSRTVWLG